MALRKIIKAPRVDARSAIIGFHQPLGIRGRLRPLPFLPFMGTARNSWSLQSVALTEPASRRFIRLNITTP